ncbi:MAG: TraR/DksA family transcriptional regulator [Nitrospira sp.]
MPNDDNLHRAASSGSEIGASPAAAITRKGSVRVTEIAEDREEAERRHQALQNMLLRKRQEIMQEIQDNVGQSLIEDQQRRLDSLSDAGDQALMDRERDRTISLLVMRNRRRQSLDEALTRLHEGTYGLCAECGIDINEKRLQAVPFAKLCVACQSHAELLEQIERTGDREDT